MTNRAHPRAGAGCESRGTESSINAAACEIGRSDGKEPAPTGSEVSIRPGIAADAVAVGALIAAAASASPYAVTLPAGHPHLVRCDPYPVDESEFRLVALAPTGGADTTVIGVCDLEIDTGFIHNLFVAPDHQGRGVGTALLDAAAELTPEPLNLKTLSTNAAALMWYERRGFRVTGGHADVWKGAAVFWIRMRRPPRNPVRKLVLPDLPDPPQALRVRTMAAADGPAVLAIYGEGIADGDGTFETTVPAWDAFAAKTIPHLRLVAEAEGQVLGWAALAPFSPRPVYGGVGVVSIYVARAARGRGIGDRLLGRLVQAAEAAGLWSLQASIFPENVASLSLHRRHGFRIAGRRERIGRMLHGPHAGQWRDTVQLERRSQRNGVSEPSDPSPDAA